eukprot:scaffold13207_cov143-Cylindrotheca_fusiformis.AAC.21
MQRKKIKEGDRVETHTAEAGMKLSVRMSRAEIGIGAYMNNNESLFHIGSCHPSQHATAPAAPAGFEVSAFSMNSSAIASVGNLLATMLRHYRPYAWTLSSSLPRNGLLRFIVAILDGFDDRSARGKLKNGKSTKAAPNSTV